MYNTIRDLISVDFKPAADFPNDDVGYGFDNIGDVLTVSPLLLDPDRLKRNRLRASVLDAVLEDARP